MQHVIQILCVDSKKTKHYIPFFIFYSLFCYIQFNFKPGIILPDITRLPDNLRSPHSALYLGKNANFVILTEGLAEVYN